ncbi:MAG: phasin family protein [Chitinophagaceae bacterium]|nr:phasin family protein [Rubrivivax sp.]
MHSSPHSSSGNGAKGGSQAGQLASSVKDSAQQIWLAGMGAFSKAQEEGTKVFEALVKEGTSLQRKTQAVAEEKIGEVTGKMSAMADTVTAKAGQNWDKLESIFEARTAKAMHKLGVPTAKDLQALVGRVDELAAVVAELGRQGPAKPAARGAEAGKRAAKTTVSPAVKPAARAGVKPAVKPAVKLAAKGAAKVPAKRATRKSAAAA